MIQATRYLAAVAALAAPPALATDTLQLQQTVLADETAAVVMLVDRERVVRAVLSQTGKRGYVVEITLAAEPNLVLTVNCQDMATGRQVIDALRGRGVATLDVSGRCWF